MKPATHRPRSSTFAAVLAAAALILPFATLSSCHLAKKAPDKAALWAQVSQEAHRSASNHGFDPASPLEARFKSIPPWLLDRLRAGDDRWDYAISHVGDSERAKLKAAVALLPASWQSILKEHLVAVYPVQNYWGGGYTEYLPEKSGAVRSYMVVNAAALQATISRWMTWKESTAFLGDVDDVRIRVDAGGQCSGFDYVFVHEAAHVVDYAMRKTPWVEADLKILYDLPGAPVPFTRGIWRDYRDPEPAWHFEGRSNLSVYGFKGKPRLPYSSAADFYRGLAKTPFVSMYAGMSWAEDFADDCAYRIIEKKIGRPIRLSVLKAGKVVYSYDPTRGEAVKARDRSGLGFD
jgi:hypothetical protein